MTLIPHDAELIMCIIMLQCIFLVGTNYIVQLGEVHKRSATSGPTCRCSCSSRAHDQLLVMNTLVVYTPNVHTFPLWLDLFCLSHPSLICI